MKEHYTYMFGRLVYIHSLDSLVKKVFVCNLEGDLLFELETKGLIPYIKFGDIYERRH